MNNSFKMWMLQNIYLIQHRMKGWPGWDLSKVEQNSCLENITRSCYSSMLPSSTKGRGSLISGAEFRLCRFTPGGTSICGLWTGKIPDLFVWLGHALDVSWVGNYLSVIIQFWCFCRGRAGASERGGEWVGGRSWYVRHVWVTAKILVAGIWRAGDYLTVASDTRSTTRG